MAALSYQSIQLAGTTPTYAAADVAGDTIPSHEHGFLLVKNGSAASVNVTIATPGKTEFGIDQPDVVVAIPAGAERAIGPMRSRLAVETGNIAVSYSAVASVTVAALYA